MTDIAWIPVAIIGGLVVVDGIASILVQGGQYHGYWFDLEREFRAMGGVVLVVIAVWRIVGF
jgi:hypothetical protein